MLLGTNQDQGQRYNRRVIFDLIRLHGSLARTDLARHAGLSYQAVSNMADDLIGNGLLTEVRKRSGRRGQPPVELSINPDGAFSLGFSFDQHTLRGALVDLAGTPRAEHETALRSAEPSVVLPAIVVMADDLIAAEHMLANRLYGLGLGMPGVSRNGRFVGPASTSSHAWLSSWADTSIVDTLQTRLGMSVYTDNDAAAAAIGELLYGEGRRFSDFVYIYISDGIGSGLVLGRKPYRGANGIAGEVGHMVVDVNGRLCSCGRRGCLETYVSLSAARRQVLQSEVSSDPQILVDLLENRDPAMLHWVEEASQMLREAIVSLENFVDPEVIFIGGTIPQPILDALVNGAIPLPAGVSHNQRDRAPRLVKAKVGLAHATLGAAALPVFEVLASHIHLMPTATNSSFLA